jgi:hypothetical protein
MASTYSTSLRIQLIGTGDQSGIWGTTTNTNLGTLIEQAITGYRTISVAGLTTYTLSSLNGTSDEARNAVLNFTGALSANCTVTAPAVNKIYIVSNNTSGGYGIIMTTGAGTTVTIPMGQIFIVYSDGTNFYFASNFNAGNVQITGGTIDGTTIGSITPSTGKFTDVTTPIIDSSTGVVTFNTTGAVVLPVGNTSQEPSPPSAGMIRFNSDNGSFEGYNGLTWGAIGGASNKTATGLWQNAQTILTNQTIDTGYNAMSTGPITIASGVSVTVPTTSTWLVL